MYYLLSNILIWDVNPQAFHIGPIDFRYYGILFAIGILVGYQIEKKIFIKENLSLKVLDTLLIYIVIGTLLGARIGHCLFYDFAYYKDHLLEILVPFENIQGDYKFVGFKGLASHGGAIGVLLSILLYCKKYHMNLFYLLDRLSVAIAATAGFIRIGNLMNSEIYGKPTSGSWGVIFALHDDLARHPTQIYESVGYFCIGLLLFWGYKMGLAQKKGLLFGLFLIGMFSTRFILEFYKENQVDFEQNMLFNMGQILSVPFLLLGLLLVLYSLFYPIKAKKSVY
ncbi:prolipoprotein diacylglyceryl transferase [Myroides sp. LJL119]